MTRPYHPYRPYRPRRLRDAHGRSGRSSRLPAPSDILFAVLALVLLLASGLAAGGLAAHPFAG